MENGLFLADELLKKWEDKSEEEFRQ